MRYRERTFHLFVDEGVYEAPSLDTWTLDSAQGAHSAPRHTLLVIYVTSPAKARWSRIDKTIVPSVVVTN
jgi:hypothetical protein